MVPDNPSLRKALTLQDRFGNTMVLYKPGPRPGLILIPRGLVQHAINHCYTTPAVDITVRKGVVPRNDMQAQVIRDSVNLLKAGNDHIIQASTGFGKTFCGLQIAAQLGTRTLVVVTKEDLLQRWQEDAFKFLSLRKTDVGIIQQDKCQYNRKLVIGMVHSLAERGYDTKVYLAFGLVIFDEVHRMAAPTFSRVAGMFNARHRLGLSATVNRTDGADPVFISHIGPVKVRASLIKQKPKVIAVGTAWKPKEKVYYTPGKLGALMVAMAKDNARNVRICKWAAAAHAKGRRTVIMSELAVDNHLEALKAILMDFSVPEEDIAYYVGGMKEKEREEAKKKPIVLATYAMCSEGTDVPEWDTLIMATPRANIIQSVGRILREQTGKQQPIVVDFVDTNIALLKGYFLKRNKQYRSTELGATVEYRFRW